MMNNLSQSTQELRIIQEESEKQERPDQKTVISVSSKLRKRLHNLPDPTNPPLGYDEHKAYDKIFPYINIPALHPKNHGDTVIFNDALAPANKLYLGDNLEVLRTLPSNFIDLIYIDPPFFSGRQYNVIWGDSNEIRTFNDIWEGGITSYLIWLNARLWEMRRVLKKTGSIYVHCDWHASHYIKTEMDKIFGYDNFANEIVWRYEGTQSPSPTKLASKHDIILRYAKNIRLLMSNNLWYEQEIDFSYSTLKKDEKGYFRIQGLGDYSEESIRKLEREGRIYHTRKGTRYLKHYIEERGGRLFKQKKLSDVWDDITQLGTAIQKEKIGYPTQKPEKLLQRIIEIDSKEGDIVSDFFCGGGTTLAIAQKLKRRFIGCDSSRVAISVTLDRLVKIGEEMSGVKSNISRSSIAGESLKNDLFDEERFQLKLQSEGIVEKVPNIEVNYLGIYPVEKFKNLDDEEFINFVLTAYGASRNTSAGVTHGYKPPAQQEPIYIGPSDPNQSIVPQEIKDFIDEIKNKVQPNLMIRAKIIAWRFSRQVLAYIKTLQNYAQKYNLPIELEAIPLDSKAFRQRILQRMPDVEEAELFLRFSKPPVIVDIKVKKVGPLEYEFEAVDAISTNEDGWLVNCQWDFDYQEGHFSADKDYILSREKKRDKKHGEIYEAVLKAVHKFEKNNEYIVACKVQDNLAGETVISKKVNVLM